MMPPGTPDVFDDILHRTLAQVVGIERTNRAKRTIEFATSPILNQAHRRVPFAFKYRSIRHDIFQRGKLGTLIDAAEIAVLDIIENLPPYSFCIALYHCIGVL